MTRHMNLLTSGFLFFQIKIFSGSFSGIPLWENPHYMSPSNYRRQIKLSAKYKYVSRVQQKVNAEVNTPTEAYKFDNYEEVFENEDLKEDESKSTKKPKPKKGKKKAKTQ